MRVLAELPHEDCKITIFSMNQKFIVKFEQGTLEQSYKLAETDVVGGVDAIFEMLDETFMKRVVTTFTEMRTAVIDAYNRHQ